MKKIGLIGQFPPPIHGLSKALDTLYNSNMRREYYFTKFDISDNKRIINIFFKLFSSNLSLYYFTISQSKCGNIRDLIIISLLLLKRKKILIHLHGGGFRYLINHEIPIFQRKLNYYILSKIDGAIVLGDSLKYIFNDILPPEKIFVVKNCIDDEFKISDREFNEKIDTFSIKSDIKILYLSNFILEKGYQEVLHLANLVNKNRDKRFKFIFAGKFFNEIDKKNFYEFVNTNDLWNVVMYSGSVYGNEKKQLLRECDYFILLTKYKKEGQPISIIEAIGNGLRVITTNHAGIKDIVDLKNMLIYDVKKDNIDKLYRILDQEYSERKQLESILIDNREKILKEFSEEEYLSSLKKIFDYFLD